VDDLLGQPDQGFCGCLNRAQWLPPMLLGGYLPEGGQMCRIILMNVVRAWGSRQCSESITDSILTKSCPCNFISADLYDQ
jgi:hypothetical protein